MYMLEGCSALHWLCFCADMVQLLTLQIKTLQNDLLLRQLTLQIRQESLALNKTG